MKKRLLALLLALVMVVALLRASRQGRETPVHLGQRIGTVKLEKT